MSNLALPLSMVNQAGRASDETALRQVRPEPVSWPKCKLNVMSDNSTQADHGNIGKAQTELSISLWRRQTSR